MARGCVRSCAWPLRGSSRFVFAERLRDECPELIQRLEARGVAGGHVLDPSRPVALLLRPRFRTEVHDEGPAGGQRGWLLGVPTHRAATLVRYGADASLGR